MANNKTIPTDACVEDFLATIKPAQKQKDAKMLLNIFNTCIDAPAVMWGSSIIGYGKYHYKYKSGREGDFFITGYAPRKNYLTIYIMCGFSNFTDLLSKLGKHKTSSSCLYINKLSDINTDILEQIIVRSIEIMKEKYPSSTK